MTPLCATLFAVLDHPDARVRGRALHALSCEHCKQGECRPGQAALRNALIAACDDPDPYVRYVAVEGLSAIIHDWDEALAAVAQVAERALITTCARRRRSLHPAVRS